MNSPGGVRIDTDSNDNHRIEELPDVATMGIGRGNHSTYDMNLFVTHLLLSWHTDGGVRCHDVTFKDVRVYNSATNFQISEEGSVNYSIIFIFQSNGLCVSHKGYLAYLWKKE